MKSTRSRAVFIAALALVYGQAVADSDEPDVPEAFEPCLSCHAYRPGEPEFDGPTLWRVMGRRIASVEGYKYSDALGKVEGTWDRATLDRFLTSPQAFAPGIRMTFGGVRSAADRAVVIDFLEALAAHANDRGRDATED